VKSLAQNRTRGIGSPHGEIQFGVVRHTTIASNTITRGAATRYLGFIKIPGKGQGALTGPDTEKSEKWRGECWLKPVDALCLAVSSWARSGLLFGAARHREVLLQHPQHEPHPP
jgi:hypothetical protein